MGFIPTEVGIWHPFLCLQLATARSRSRRAAQTSTARRSRLKHYQGNMAGTSGGHLGEDEVGVGHQATSGARQDQDQHSAPPLSIYDRPPTCCSAPCMGASVLSQMLSENVENTLRLRFALLILF